MRFQWILYWCRENMRISVIMKFQCILYWCRENMSLYYNTTWYFIHIVLGSTWCATRSWRWTINISWGSRNLLVYILNSFLLKSSFTNRKNWSHIHLWNIFNMNIILIAAHVNRYFLHSTGTNGNQIVRGLCDLDCNEFFTFAHYSNTRGHNFKLSGPVCKNNWLFNFFTNRVISYWNFLPAEVVNAESFGTFNAKLNSVDLRKFCILGRA